MYSKATVNRAAFEAIFVNSDALDVISDILIAIPAERLSEGDAAFRDALVFFGEAKRAAEEAPNNEAIQTLATAAYLEIDGMLEDKTVDLPVAFSRLMRAARPKRSPR